MNESILRLRQALAQADAVFIGAGAGLSTAAGFLYAGERFERYFGDFARAYGFRDMYSGGFYPYQAREEYWAYWSRYIWINRYMPAPRPVYQELLRAVAGKDYFVLTTNVDHCFQKAGFDKRRLFYTQGDYGLFQCSKPCRPETFENQETIRAMVLAQGYTIGPENELTLPMGEKPLTRVPAALLPRCPHCGRPLTMNLRADDTFVEDAGWHAAAAAYDAFAAAHQADRALYLEIGVGYNTPGIIKYNFWQQVDQNPRAVYACLNVEEAPVPREIRDRAIVIGGDSAEAIRALLS